MRLEKYKDKKETRKKVMLIGLTVMTIVSVTMLLFKSFANFRQTVSFPIMSGKVKYKPKGKDLTDVVKPTTSGDSNGNGLFEVTPTGPSSNWQQKEYRYAGPNPNNYVYFNCDNGKDENSTNCELWRIIGLVNVKTLKGPIEQRMKIIRNDSIGEYAWDRDQNSSYTNNWINSKLKEMLNDGYYNGSETPIVCYRTRGQSIAESSATCKFDSTTNPKSLTSKAKDMIDNEVSWNLGGSSTNEVTTDSMYNYERSPSVVSGNATEWSRITDPNGYKGVGLIYPSDYGYAVGGSVRSSCLKKVLHTYTKDNCYTNNWLVISGNSSAILWFITPDSVDSKRAFCGASWTGIDSLYVYGGFPVRPAVFLNSNVKIGEGEGTKESPYTLVM